MISYLALEEQYSSIADSVEEDLRNCLRKCHYVTGHYIERFERTLGNLLYANHVTSINNSTEAYAVIIEALGIRPDDYVIVPNNAALESMAGLLRAVRPIFVDVSPDTYLIDMEQVEKTLLSHPKRKKIKAIVVVDLYGQQPNMEQISEFAREHKISIIEDASHAIGSTHRNKHVGYYSHIVMASFQPEYNLGSIGQGAAIITNDSMLSKKIRTIISEDPRDVQMNSLVAAQLYHSIKNLFEWNARRRDIARIYNDEFNSDQRPTQQPCGKHVYTMYQFKCKDNEQRHDITKALLENNIGYSVTFRKVLSEPLVGMMETPVAHELCGTLISLPCNPFMTKAEVIEVILSIQTSLKIS